MAIVPSINEGTVFSYFPITDEWPPKQDVALYKWAQPDGTIEIQALSSARLYIRILDDTGEVLTVFRSQELQVESPGIAVFAMTWKNDKIRLFISNEPILHDTASNNPKTLKLFPLAPSHILSTDHREASTNCQEWVEFRDVRFRAITNQKNRPDERPKSAKEQIDDLIQSVQCLSYMRLQILDGNTYLVGALATQLRALLYWDKPVDRHYNPLLLRMADKAKLPLPVYMMAPMARRRLSTENDYTHFDSNMARTVSIYQTDIIADFQSWLSGTVMWIVQAQSKEVSAKDLLQKISVIHGAAHYDETSSEFVDTLETFIIGNTDRLAQFVTDIADVTIELANFILRQLEVRNLDGR